MKVLTVTGYKPMEINIFNEQDEKITYVKRALERRLIEFIEGGLAWVLISGQIGVEMWTADVVNSLKDKYDINLAVIPPFENLSERWPEELQYKFSILKREADFYRPLYKGRYKGGYQFRVRDQWFVEKSDACLLLIDEENPGTVRYFRNVAKSYHNYPIYTITPFDLEEVVIDMQMEDPSFWES